MKSSSIISHDFILHLLIINDVEYLFIRSLAICMSSFINSLFWSFVYFELGCLSLVFISGDELFGGYMYCKYVRIRGLYIHMNDVSWCIEVFNFHWSSTYTFLHLWLELSVSLSESSAWSKVVQTARLFSSRSCVQWGRDLAIDTQLFEHHFIQRFSFPHWSFLATSQFMFSLYILLK